MVEVLVTPGQQVVAGDVLLRLDSPAARDRLRQAREVDAAAAGGRVALGGGGTRELAALQARADAAAADGFAASREAAGLLPEGPARDAALARVAQSEAEYAVTRTATLDAVRRVDAGLTQVGEAVSSLAAAQRVQTRAAVELAEQAVGALEVRAPITGVVQLGAVAGGGGAPGDLLGQLPPAVQAQAGALLGGAGAGGGAAVAAPALAVGAPVGAGDPLVTVVDVGELSLTAEVDETDVLRVAPGATATAELDAVPGARYDATVAAVDLEPSTSAAGGVSYRVRLVLGAGRLGDAAAPAPRPGMSAVVDLVVAEVTDALTVPVTAVQRDPDPTGGAGGAERASVWLSRDGVAERRRVELGAEGDDVVAVARGLAAGDRVVVRGADTVAEGQELPGVDPR